jgi:hypothetical protein
MEHVADRLEWLFTSIFYPGILIGVFVTLVLVVVRLVAARDFLRRLVASLLPLAVLVFVKASSDQIQEPLAPILASAAPATQFISGAVVGAVLLEAGRRLLRHDVGAGPAFYCLLLSSIIVFLLYCFMSADTSSLHLFMLGLIIFAGLHVVFRGPPELRPN